MKLYAPKSLRSLGIGDDDYMVAEDGTVEVKEKHVDQALSHGFRKEPIVEPVAAATAGDALAEAVARITALEAKVAALTSPTPPAEPNKKAEKA